MGKKSDTHFVSVAESVHRQIKKGGERIWRISDFGNLPFTAIAQALSRLSRKGVIQRISKGLYYHCRETAFGPSKPNPSHIQALCHATKGMFPAGIAAANLLGFSTQNAARMEVATHKLSLPRMIVGKKTIIHTRRPESWKDLSETDAAILDFLRSGGKSSELPIDDTVQKLLQFFQKKGQFERLYQIANAEPPRVRALLGAIGQQIHCRRRYLIDLKKSLNPLSKFDFGNLCTLQFAKEWQAKEQNKP